MKKENTTIDPTSNEYKNMIDLLAVLSEATNQMRELEAEINEEMLSEIDSRRADYSALQKTLTDAEAALELIAVKHPEWFGEKKSLKTLYGAIEKRDSTSLDVANAELSLALIDAEAKRDAKFDPDLYVRTVRSLNLEALGVLTDAELEKFKITRVKKTNYSIKPMKVDMGKAVKEAAERKTT